VRKLPGAVSARAIPVDVWIAAGIVIIAAAIRIIVIDNQSFWWDEALTAYESSLPFGAMIHTVARVETTPPLYFVLVWGWAHVFGTGEIALRSVSTIAGIALVPIAFLCAKELVSRWAGVVAAALVAVNPFMIWYSQEARAYMLLAALTGASFLWFIRARREPTRRSLAWWAVLSSLAIMTHFFAGFAIAPEAVWLLWQARTRAVVAAVAVVAVAQAAMLPFAGADSTHGVGWIPAIARIHRIATATAEWGVSLVYRRGTVPEDLIGGAVFLAIVVLLLAIGGDKRTREGAKVAGVVAAFVWLAPLALALVGQDYFLSRNLIPAFVPLVTVVAAACTVPRARLLGAAFAIALLVMFADAALTVQTTPGLERPNWQAIGHTIGPTAVPRAIVFTGDNYAIPLKLYVPHVNWVQPSNQQVRIDEVNLVGLLKWLPPTRTAAPDAMRLIGVRTSSGVGIDRYALHHPITASVNELALLAPHLFRHYRGPWVVFFQQPGP
jgi:uncharacterized membrane protein